MIQKQTVSHFYKSNSSEHNEIWSEFCRFDAKNNLYYLDNNRREIMKFDYQTYEATTVYMTEWQIQNWHLIDENTEKEEKEPDAVPVSLKLVYTTVLNPEIVRVFDVDRKIEVNSFETQKVSLQTSQSFVEIGSQVFLYQEPRLYDVLTGGVMNQMIGVGKAFPQSVQISNDRKIILSLHYDSLYI